MNSEQVLEAQMADRFAALGAPARVRLLRLLVRAGDEGLPVGEIQKALGLPASTLAHHMQALVHSGLLIQDKQGREVRSRVNYDAVRSIGIFLIERCCEGVPARP